MRSRPLPPVAGRCAIKHRAAPLTYNVGPHIFGYFDDRETMKISKIILLITIVFVSQAAVSLAASDTALQTHTDIDLRKACLYEGKAYSIGSKIQFTYNLSSGLVAQEVLECIEANTEKKDSGAFWKRYSVSCKNPISNKSEVCL